MMIEKTHLDIQIEEQEKQMKAFELQHKFDEGFESGVKEGVSKVMGFMDLMILSSEKWDQERKEEKLSRRVGNLPAKIRAKRELYKDVLDWAIAAHGYSKSINEDYIRYITNKAD